MSSVLAYWNIRGLAQPIRFLLNYVGEDFEDKYYACGPAPDFSKDGWYRIKNSFGLDFPNLPYYKDADVSLTQSNAILRYLARKHNKFSLDGKTIKEKARVDLMAEQSMDFRNASIELWYGFGSGHNIPYEQMLPQYMKDLAVKLGQIEKFLGDGKWFAGDTLTWVDFVMYELLDQHHTMDAKCLDDTPKLKQFLNRFEELPEINAYMASSKFIKWPIHNPIARWGWIPQDV